jgi:hypothetical protein
MGAGAVPRRSLPPAPFEPWGKSGNAWVIGMRVGFPPIPPCRQDYVKKFTAGNYFSIKDQPWVLAVFRRKCQIIFQTVKEISYILPNRAASFWVTK